LQATVPNRFAKAFLPAHVPEVALQYTHEPSRLAASSPDPAQGVH